jgi:hypothetical protein
MTRHDELIRLQHMLDAAREAVELVLKTVENRLPLLIRQLEAALR